MFEKFFKKKTTEAEVLDPLIGTKEIVAVKPTKKQEDQQFMRGFDQDYILKNEKLSTSKENGSVHSSGSVAIGYRSAVGYFHTSITNTAIVGGLTHSGMPNKDMGFCVMSDMNISHPDLKFMGISRINGKPIYKFTGTDFSSIYREYKHCNLEELVSLQNYEVK